MRFHTGNIYSCRGSWEIVLGIHNRKVCLALPTYSFRLWSYGTSYFTANYNRGRVWALPYRRYGNSMLLLFVKSSSPNPCRCSTVTPARTGTVRCLLICKPTLWTVYRPASHTYVSKINFPQPYLLFPGSGRMLFGDSGSKSRWPLKNFTARNIQIFQHCCGSWSGSGAFSTPGSGMKKINNWHPGFGINILNHNSESLV